MVHSLSPGIVIENKYRVEKVLKTGAVAQAAVVCRTGAPETKLVLRLSITGQGTQLQNEGNILRQFSLIDESGHQGIVKEAAAFVDEGWYEGSYYLVTEYLAPADHTTVEQAWAQGKGEDWIVPVGRAFVQFLAKLHRRGWEYYDVKLDHLYWNTSSSTLRVIDFNLCRHHDLTESIDWQQEDLRKTAVLIAEMLQRSRRLPECSYPLPLPLTWLPVLDIEGLKGVSDPTRVVLSRLHGGFYGYVSEGTDAAARDWEEVEKNPDRWLEEAKNFSRTRVEECIKRARDYIEKMEYNRAWEVLREAWACLPFKRVEADPANDPLATKVYLCALRLMYPDIGESFLYWLDGRYDEALDQLRRSACPEASQAMRWLQARRDIDDVQRAQWKGFWALLQKGSHADALVECECYCRNYPNDQEAQKWQVYLKKVLRHLNACWQLYGNYLYPLVMAKTSSLPQILAKSPDSELLMNCWQQDTALQKMDSEMRRAVELTDVAWQYFAVSAFATVQTMWNYTEQATKAAIELHASACGRRVADTTKTLESTRQTIEGWRTSARDINDKELSCRKILGSGDLKKASRGYGELEIKFEQILKNYLEQRGSWADMLPLAAENDAFPASDYSRLFGLVKASLEGARRQGCLLGKILQTFTR